ncbi:MULTISPECIES: hypothetical protein [Clostridium]|uniref:Uncharacterized protein n=1 Tax=Clostridium sporogenes TaxID=1509 RepID=A0A1J1CSB2_CLOSG|nr:MULTISPECIES: hypothetical protein [Clostridium]APF25145.1 hypothetical protein NPD7_4010 [Clostridium sporogenes]APH15883.1 hypothetical protein NPD5_3789 [Clostridium sporogenes]KEI94088.1 hypothetical protein N494_18375 [Clostridium botulinum A2B7 92]MBD5640075.1 hypothetical protein [Clostridium botulinum]MDI6920003.1 hypothetical protein [Clostridium botulinum]
MYLLNGDLNQMSIQKTQLLAKGIQILQCDVYPAINEKKDYIKALRIIWNEKIEGWWNYKGEFLEYKICTEEEFTKGFDD